MQVIEKERHVDITLSAEQEALFQIMEHTREHMFITGHAGTGKSCWLDYARTYTKKRAVVVASTGIAAVNVKAKTIHSLFGLAPRLHQKGTLPKNSRICTILSRVEIIFIDEGSMVRADLLDALDERMQEACHNTLPFGGVQVVIIGDPYQLPPVVEEGLVDYFEDIYGGHFFFHALVWKQCTFKIYELTQIFRQEDPVFKQILNAVRDGTITDTQLDQLNTCYGRVLPNEGTVTLATKNALVTEINQRRLDALPGKEYTYTATLSGEMKKSMFPTEEHLHLKEGAQVILLRNDMDGRWVNGSVGIIEELTEEKVTIRLGTHIYQVQQETWEEIEYTYDPSTRSVEMVVVSSFTQYPLRLGYAVTVHKSQGQTYTQVVLDLTAVPFAAGQLYVALSRCTSMQGLSLTVPVTRKHIIVDPKVTEFMLRQEIIIKEGSAL